MNKRIKELAEQAAGGMLSYHAEGDWYLSENEVECITRQIVERNKMISVDIKEQLLALAYDKEDEVFGSSERREFDCLIELIDDGTIDSFEELAKYGVMK